MTIWYVRYRFSHNSKETVHYYMSDKQPNKIRAAGEIAVGNHTLIVIGTGSSWTQI